MLRKQFLDHHLQKRSYLTQYLVVLKCLFCPENGLVMSLFGITEIVVSIHEIDIFRYFNLEKPDFFVLAQNDKTGHCGKN